MENVIKIDQQNSLLDASPAAFNSILKGFVNRLVLNGVGRLVAMRSMDYSITLGANTACDNSLSGVKLIERFYQDNYVEVCGRYVEGHTIHATRITFGNNKTTPLLTNNNREVEFEGKVTRTDEPRQIVVSNIVVYDEVHPSAKRGIADAFVPGDGIIVSAYVNANGKLIAKSIRSAEQC